VFLFVQQEKILAPHLSPIVNLNNPQKRFGLPERIVAAESLYVHTYEPRHNKTNIMGLQPAWIQTSLRIRAVWSGSMLFAISFSTCYRVCKRTAWILISLSWWAGWSGSMLVANALCWFCHGTAHIFDIFVYSYCPMIYHLMTLHLQCPDSFFFFF
jgi:hypothetical protein